MHLILSLLLSAQMAAGTGTPAVMPDVRVRPSPEVRTLRADLARILRSQGWRGDLWSVLVVSLDHGDTLFAHAAERPLMPASNLKLFTTAGALHYLGPDYRYSTYVAAQGPIRGDEVQGDLLVYGTGDPTISGRFFPDRTSVFRQLADSLAAQGIRRIRGDLVADGTYFSDGGVGEGWKQSYVNAWYAASASGLSFNDNVVTLRIMPAPTVGWRPRVEMIPGGDGIGIVNEASTTLRGRTYVRVGRPAYDGPIVLDGQIRLGRRAVWRRVPVASPPRFAAAVFREVLEERGIRVDGAVRVVRDPAGSPVSGRRHFAPAFRGERAPQVLAVHRSPPLQAILEVINQRSHNFYAEMVLRTVGRVATGVGSARAGERAIRAMVRDRTGVELDALRMDDGSGLSILNRASAGSFITLLSDVARSEHWPAFRATLPEAATSRGLRRMRRTAAAGNLRAKTGTISRVSALSGYVRARNGERLAFSILSNNVPSTWKAKRLEDRIGIRLARFDRPRPERTPDLPGAAPAVAEAPTDRADGRADDYGSGPLTHTIRRGDTFDRIAREYGTTVGALRAANPGLNPRRLIPGGTLWLPSGAREPGTAAPAEPQAQYHVIRPGDTFDGLARRYGTTIAALRAANPGVDPRRLIPGRRLALP